MAEPTKEGLAFLETLTQYVVWHAGPRKTPPPIGHIKKFEAFLESHNVKRDAGFTFLVYLIGQMKESRGFGT